MEQYGYISDKLNKRVLLKEDILDVVTQEDIFKFGFGKVPQEFKCKHPF
jgi:hypothetical protein